MATTISEFLAIQHEHEDNPNVRVTWVGEDTIIWTKVKGFGMFTIYTNDTNGVLVVKQTRREQREFRSNPRYVGGSATARKLCMQNLAEQSGGPYALRDYLTHDLV
jgi:hypothetical protein